MIKSILMSAKELFIKYVIISCLIVAASVLAVDYITGQYIKFPILYALPVGMAAWQNRKILAYLIALLLPCARIGFYFLWQETQLLSIALLNFPINIMSLLLYAYLVARIARQTISLKKKVRTLEGILPICASCKRIQNDKGEYEQLDKYITEHSEASFSHGLCPDCAKKLYPDFFEDIYK